MVITGTDVLVFSFFQALKVFLLMVFLGSFVLLYGEFFSENKRSVLYVGSFLLISFMLVFLASYSYFKENKWAIAIAKEADKNCLAMYIIKDEVDGFRLTQWINEAKENGYNLVYQDKKALVVAKCYQKPSKGDSK